MELANYESDKRLQMDFQAGLAQSEEFPRAHVHEGSCDTTDTQKNIQHRVDQFAQQVKVTQQQVPELRHTAGFSEERRRRVIDLFEKNFNCWNDAKSSLSSRKITIDLPFPFVKTEIPKLFIFKVTRGTMITWDGRCSLASWMPSCH